MHLHSSYSKMFGQCTAAWAPALPSVAYKLNASVEFDSSRITMPPPTIRCPALKVQAHWSGAPVCVHVCVRVCVRVNSVFGFCYQLYQKLILQCYLHRPVDIWANWANVNAVRCKRIKQSCESLCQTIVVHASYYNDGCEQLHLFILYGSIQTHLLDSVGVIVRPDNNIAIFGIALALINKHVQIQNIPQKAICSCS